MQFDTTYLTEAGRSLATDTLGGLDKIQFTRAVASSHDYSGTPVNDLKKLTSLEDVQQTVNYSRIIKKDDTTLTMRVDFPSKDVTTAYSLYTVGFYARPENGDEILYGVLPSSLPDYIAAYDGKSNLNDSFQTDTTVSDADNVLITVSQAGSLNEADLDAIFASKHIATIDDIKANIPATVIDGSKPADFKEPVTLEKGAVDGAGNAIATTKNVSDGDAKTLTSAKEYADAQVGDKVKTADTANWQKTKISADDGSPKSFLYAKDGGNITMWIAGRPLGIHTFWCAAGVTGNPVSSSIQGTMSISSVKNGVGYCVSADGDFISITLVDGQVSYSVLANAANVVDRNPDTGTISKPTDFTNLTVNGGKSVATRDDLKSLEASAWRPLTLENSQHGVILFKDNGDGTASLTGSATFIIGKGKATFFPIIIPPVGYTFTSLKWTKSNDGNSVYAVSGMTGSSAGTTTVVTAGLSNGNICFGGGTDGSYAVTFSPSELTTLRSGINCNPALVSISKV